MPRFTLLRPLAAAASFAAALALPFHVTAAEPAKPPAKPAAKTARKPTRPAKAPVVEYVPEAAGSEQIDAAERVYYGVYECEFNQKVDIRSSAKYPSYVDVHSGKSVYLMRPVLSSTGAIRLEDIKGEMLMVQIASKSMLMNVKTARREVDDCVSPAQRDLIEKMRLAKLQETADAAAAKADPAAAAASAPAAAASDAK